LERFKDLPIYVRCIESPSDSSSETLEKDGIAFAHYGALKM
jgi:hypothetical protein